MKKQITLDGNRIEDISSFYDEINRVFMHSETWKIGQSLDAFHDLLYGGYGELVNSEPMELHWTNLDKSRQVLGHAATRAYYMEKLAPGSPYNKALFYEKLAALEAGQGETYFDLVLSIIAEHPNIALRAG
ncbi:barstar family protein [Dyadobacter sandarakinus]|uniref:Barstar family protein n=1 Tax=Dyadobacter sandarakinus TaxID=2747268 RepID=A0ABX7I3A0_9BACT|nr:barstar family protein [Dyadobacter sandarakinus]QRR00208.1 barstar family protein [Dyadobacter sandarakinus]